MRAVDLTDLCTVVYQRCEETWDKLVDDWGAGVIPLEDQFSQELLSTLGRRFGHLTQAWWQHSYSGSAEGGEVRPNADWDIFVADDEGWTGVRVQAKLLDPGSGEYPDLNRGHAKKLIQAQRLIRNAASDPSGPAPLYGFFNAWPDPAPARIDGRTAKSIFRRALGISVVPAPAVLQRLQRRGNGGDNAKVGFDDFAHKSFARPFCSPRQASARKRLSSWIDEMWSNGIVPPDSPTPNTDPVSTEALPRAARAAILQSSADPEDQQRAASWFATGILDEGAALSLEQAGVLVMAQDVDVHQAVLAHARDTEDL